MASVMRQNEPTASMPTTPNKGEEIESRAAIHWHVRKLLKQADRNLIKFNEGEYRLWTNCLKAALQATTWVSR